MRPFRPVVKTVPFHGENTGSIPVKVNLVILYNLKINYLYLVMEFTFYTFILLLAFLFLYCFI